MRSIHLITVACVLQGCLQHELEEKIFTDLLGNQISYTVSGQGKTVVFLHAGGLDKSMWAEQQRLLQTDFKTIAYDLNGHGNSKRIAEERFEIDDITTLLEHETITEKVILVGCSLGAIVALDYALTHPNRVDKLVLVSPGVLGFQEKDSVYLTQLMTYVRALQSADEQRALEALKIMNATGETERTLGRFVDDYVNKSLQAFLRTGGYLQVPRFHELAPLNVITGLKQDILLLYGALDHAYIKRNVEVLQSSIHQVLIVEVGQVGHLVNLENPTLFNQHLIAFIKP